MSTVVEYDEGFVTNIGSELSITDIKVKMFIKLSYYLFLIPYKIELDYRSLRKWKFKSFYNLFICSKKTN
jgi:hypothetical protein